MTRKNQSLNAEDYFRLGLKFQALRDVLIDTVIELSQKGFPITSKELKKLTKALDLVETVRCSLDSKMFNEINVKDEIATIIRPVHVFYGHNTRIDFDNLTTMCITVETDSEFLNGGKVNE